MTIALVNSCGLKEAVADASISAPALNCTTGNTIIVLVTNYTALAPQATGATDTAGNTYTQCGLSVNSGDWTGDCFVAWNITGHATNVVNATFENASTTNRGIVVLQYSGLCSASNPYDSNWTDTGFYSSAGTDPVVTNSWYTRHPESLIVGLFIHSNSTTLPTAYGDYSPSLLQIQVDESSSPNMGVTHRIVSSPGTYEVQMDIIGGSGYQFYGFSKAFFAETVLSDGPHVLRSVSPLRLGA